MPDQPTHPDDSPGNETFTEEPGRSPRTDGQAGGSGVPASPSASHVRPARPAMIVTGC